jgi:hypothetical protein
LFLANSWPESQHGYTRGRGVNTAWKLILSEVIKCSNIYEFDLVGYFNNITHRCVVRQLSRFQVPKYIVIMLVELSCSPVAGIGMDKLLENLEAEPKTFAAD